MLLSLYWSDIIVATFRELHILHVLITIIAELMYIIVIHNRQKEINKDLPPTLKDHKHNQICMCDVYSD